jgi:hypothetical protein
MREMHHLLVGHELPIGLVERSYFHAVTSNHATAVVRRTGPRHVRTGFGHGHRGSAGWWVWRSCAQRTRYAVKSSARLGKIIGGGLCFL